MEAENVAGTQTVVPATYVSLCRDDPEDVVVAGKDLCAALGFLTPVEQKRLATARGVNDNWLGPSNGKRAYVMSKETKIKIAVNQRRQAQATKVRPQGTMYVGSCAMANTKLVQWVKEPTMKTSYITPACLGSASTSATPVESEGAQSDLRLERFQEIADWMTSEDEFADATTVRKVVSIDVIRVLREVFPSRRIHNAKFKVIQSAHMRAVLGQDILNELDKQDYDLPCPLQSDIEYDEQEEVKTTWRRQWTGVS